MRADFGYDKKAGEEEDKTKDLSQKVFRSIKKVSQRVDDVEEAQKNEQVQVAKRMMEQGEKIQKLASLTDKQKTDIAGLNALIDELKS